MGPHGPMDVDAVGFLEGRGLGQVELERTPPRVSGRRRGRRASDSDSIDDVLADEDEDENALWGAAAGGMIGMRPEASWRADPDFEALAQGYDGESESDGEGERGAGGQLGPVDDLDELFLGAAGTGPNLGRGGGGGGGGGGTRAIGGFGGSVALGRHQADTGVEDLDPDELFCGGDRGPGRRNEGVDLFSSPACGRRGGGLGPGGASGGTEDGLWS